LTWADGFFKRMERGIMIPCPEQCVDLETGNKFWRFLRGEIIVSEREERVRLHQHTWQCPACLREVARNWLRNNVRNGRIGFHSSSQKQTEEDHLEALLALLWDRMGQQLQPPRQVS